MAQFDSPAQPTATEQRLHDLEDRVRELQKRQAMQPGAMLERMVPPAVRTHLRAARREQLLALRAWIDVAIKRTEPSEERAQRAESVRID